MGLLPRMLVGLGDFGIRVIQEIAVQARQSYGDIHRLALLGIDFADQSAVIDPNVRYQCIYADPKEWFKSSQLPPTVTRWFDIESYRAKTLKRSQPERQVARLFLFRHLAAHPGVLSGLFQRELGRLSNFTQEDELVTGLEKSVRSISVYLLGASVDAAASGTLWDIAQLIHAAARQEGFHARIFLYLALPGALTAYDVSETAATYAILRELERFGTGVEQWLHMADKDYPLIYAARLYDTPIDKLESASQDLVALWVDVLLPQLDENFGAAITQHEINLYAEKHDLPQAYLVGTQDSTSTIFPRLHLLEQWSNRIAYEVYQLWLQPPLDSKARQELLQRWTGGLKLLSGQEKIETPPLLSLFHRWWTASESPSTLASQFADTPSVVNQLLSSSRLADRTAAALEDSLEAQAAEYAPVMETYHSWLSAALKREYGSLTPQKSRKQGEIWQRLESALVAERTLFEESLLAWTLYLLNEERIGLHNVVRLLHSVEQLLQKALQIVELVFQRFQQGTITHLGQTDHLLDYYQQLIAQIPEGPRNLIQKIIPRNRAQETRFETYQDTAWEIIVRLRQETQLERLPELIRFHIQFTQRLSDILKGWSLHLERGLSIPLRQRISDISDTPQPAPSRLWLQDSAWIQKQYQTLFDENFFQQVLAAFQWKLEGTNPLKIVPLLAGKPLDQRPEDFWQAENLRLWRIHVFSVVETRCHNLDIWSYLFSADSRLSHPQQLGQFLKNSHTLLTYEMNGSSGRPPRLNSFIVLPEENSPQKLSYGAELISELQHPKGTISESTATRFTHLRLGEFIPLHRLYSYQEAENAFYRIPLATRRRLLHIFPEEVTAAEYEAEVQDTCKLPRFQFSVPFMKALSYPERINLFLWARATGFIRFRGQTGTVLTLPEGGTWPLGEGNKTHLLYPFVNFCFSDAALPYEQIQAAVDKRLGEAARELIANWEMQQHEFDDPDIQDWVKSLQKTHCAYAAAIAAYRLLVLKLQRLDHEEQLALVENEYARELHYLFIGMAGVQIRRLRQQIRLMVETQNC